MGKYTQKVGFRTCDEILNKPSDFFDSNPKGHTMLYAASDGTVIRQPNGEMRKLTPEETTKFVGEALDPRIGAKIVEILVNLARNSKPKE